jgi:hypothetical protein
LKYEHALMTGARWLRRAKWGKNRWAYVMRTTAEVVGVTEADMKFDDWMVSYRTPENVIAYQAPGEAAERKSLSKALEDGSSD